MSGFGLEALRPGEYFIDACGVRLRAIVDLPPGLDTDFGSASGFDSASEVAADSGSVIKGRGAPVLVLHGFTGSAESMASVSASLCDRHPVIRLELIGHGGSDCPAESECYAMDACARQIADVVGQLGIEPPHLLGYSMGGRAAIAAALSHPELFASLLLVGATAGIADPVSRRSRVKADRMLADRIENVPLAEFVDAWMALPIFSSQKCLGEGALERARAQRMRNQPVGLANSLRGMGAGAQAPLFDHLANFTRPVLVVAGGEDEKFTEIAAALSAAFPNARREIVSGAGHAVHLEAPEKFGELVKEFLTSSSSSSSESDRV